MWIKGYPFLKKCTPVFPECVQNISYCNQKDFHTYPDILNLSLCTIPKK